MEDTIDILKKLALQVRNASSAGENTAERVGRVLSGILEFVDADIDIEELKKLFLGKYGPDETEHLLRLLGGIFVRGGIDTDSITVGDYVPGWIGSGSAITVDEKTGKTKLEVDEVLARDRIEAIEYRFNRVEVIEGEQWSTFAFGTIKSVDIENQIAYLDLLDGELMSSHKNDLNRGIFHNISSANATESKIDDCGFYTQAGFSTSYFTPTEILPKGNGFKYALRAGTTQHPCAGMKFAAYGNPTDPNRRMSRVTNLKHTIYLKDVSVWQIDPNIHYGAAYGDLTGITINGVEFNGYSSFQTNGYFKGYIEFLPEQKEELKGKDGYSVSLSSYDAVVAVNSDGEIDSSLYDIINIVSGNESAYTGDNQIVTTKYKIQTTIQATCGATKLEQSDVVGAGKYVVSVTATGCEYHLSDGVITITKITQDKATLDIEINCEGIAVVKKVFTLTRVYGERGADGINGANGVNGKDGVSIVFKGEFSSHPANPQNGWSYYNTTDKKSYVFQSGAWYRMTVDGVNGINGANGKDGLSVDYKGDLQNPPANPQKNWCYRDTDNGCVYLYNGTAWALMVADGSDGANGTNGTNGLSVFITYNDGESKPATPTGNGTSGGWHTAPNENCIWMSQKVAVDAQSGSWGAPIRIRGNTGPQGVPGTPGVDGKVLYTWIRYANNANGSGISNDPTGKLYIGFAYNKETATESNTPSDYMWSLMKGADGTNGVPGAPGTDGKTTYTWIAYSDNADGFGMYQAPRDSTKYIGIAVNKDTKIEGTNPADYTWSLFKGKDGADGKPGTDANLLPWFKPWDDNKTMIDGEWVASPKMFSGTKNPDTGKLTGIAQGVDCITIDGKKRTGIFALVDNEVVFELDPMTKRYVFRGTVYADDGIFKGKVEIAGGKILLNEDGSGQLAGGSIFWDSNGVLYNRHRSRILWRSISQEMNDAGISSPSGVYSLGAGKGTFLDVLTTFEDQRRIQMPIASRVPGTIFDARCIVVSRMHSSYIFVSSYDYFFIHSKSTNEYVSVDSVLLESKPGESSGFLESININGSYGWLASGDFIEYG